MSGPRPTHLLRRGAIYAARFRLPSDLARTIGVTEMRRSLHTADPKEARDRCLKATVWFRVTVERLRSMSPPTKTDLEAAARAYFDDAMSALAKPEPFFAEAYDELALNIEATSDRLQQLEDQLRKNNFDGKVVYAAGQISLRAGCKEEDVVSLETQQLAARVEREEMRFLLHRFRNPWTKYVMDDAVLAALPARSSHIGEQRDLTRSNGPSIAVAVGRYLDRKRIAGVGSSQLDEVGRALLWLQDHFGKDTPLSAVSKGRLRDFRDGLERLDSRLKGRGGYLFAERQTPNSAHWISSVTSTRHWRAAQSFFAWATAEELLTSDPSSGLKILRRKDDISRTPAPFTADELKRLFASPLFAGHKSPKQLLVVGGSRERGGFWWAGILALYTGMRAGEIAQLLPSDFDFDANIPVIHVRPDDPSGARSKRVKTPASVRDVPIAKSLLELGLREFVAGRRKRFKDSRLMREINLGQKDRTSDGMSKFWGRAVRVAGVHKPGRSFHVFRHTFTASMRRAEVPEEVIGAVLGHQPASMTGQYGGKFPAAQLAKAVAAIDFGLDVVEAVGGPYHGQIGDEAASRSTRSARRSREPHSARAKGDLR